MRGPVAFWLSVVGSLGALDYALNTRHNGTTFSEVTRLLFRTDTAAGRRVFTLALSGGGFWFHQHIVKGDAAWAPCSTR